MKLGQLAYILILLIGVLTVGAIARGWKTTDSFHRHSYDAPDSQIVLGDQWITNDKIAVSLLWGTRNIPRVGPARDAFSYTEWRTEPNYGYRPSFKPALGFYIGQSVSPDGSPVTRISISHWPVIVLLVGLSIVQFKSRLRERIELTRRNQGRCVSCGYDLRTSPQKCPECGKVVDAETSLAR